MSENPTTNSKRRKPCEYIYKDTTVLKHEPVPKDALRCSGHTVINFSATDVPIKNKPR